MNNILGRLIKEIFKFPVHFVISVFLVLSAAFLDTLSPRIVQWAVDNIITTGDRTYVFQYALFFIVYIILQTILTFAFIKVVGSLEIKFLRMFRRKIFKKVQCLGMDYFNKNDDGWIIARLTSDVEKISEIMSWQFVDSFYFIIVIIVSIITIFTFSFQAGLIVIVIYPILYFLINLVKKGIFKNYQKVRKQNSILVSKYNELINGIMTVKTMNIEDRSMKDFELENYKLRRNSRKVYFYQALFVPILITVGYLIVIGTLNFSARSFLNGTLTSGEIAAIMMYAMLLVEVTSEFTAVISEIQHAKANAERIFGLLDSEESITDRQEVIEKYGDRFNVKNIEEEIEGKIEFKNVCFDYEDGEKLFEDLNLTIESGTSVALVGSTGSGKTTIVNLLSRFYKPISGEILLDDKPLEDRSVNWLHHSIGHVLQFPFLFKGSVKDNIKYNHDITDEKVEEICNLLSLNTIIDRLENGIDTQVGEGGSKLSVGEKQLISFARALAHDPKIVILDEATSSIDSESERLIQNAINKIMNDRTSVVIAHRLSTIEKCDKIVFLKKGKILEAGSHEELLEKKGYYYDMYHAS